MPPIPTVAVLLATHDGVEHLREQVDSILGQKGVRVELYASDDMSTDGTWELLQAWAKAEPRLRLLPREARFGRAAGNFYHLLLSVPSEQYDAMAFSDQDDVWSDWKLQYHFALMSEQGVGGISSTVVAFWPDGRSRILKKACSLRRYDHLFQGPGPGCTFLLSPLLIQVIRTCLSQPGIGASRFLFHDWLIYAIARTCGFGWHISARPSLRYRQHASNEWGANVGLGAAARRVRWLLDGTYRQWIGELLDILERAASVVGAPPPPPRLSGIQIALHGRRRLTDRLLVAAAMARGVSRLPPSALEVSGGQAIE